MKLHGICVRACLRSYYHLTCVRMFSNFYHWIFVLFDFLLLLVSFIHEYCAHTKQVKVNALSTFCYFMWSIFALFSIFFLKSSFVLESNVPTQTQIIEKKFGIFFAYKKSNTFAKKMNQLKNARSNSNLFEFQVFWFCFHSLFLSDWVSVHFHLSMFLSVSVCVCVSCKFKM